MSLVHRIRMALLMRKANIILKNSRRPYVPSVHLTSYPVERQPDCGITPFYIAVVVVAIGLVVYLNFFHAEPDGLHVACVQTAGSK